MSLKIVCSGHLIRYPLGGHLWHHLQYLVGFRRMGHEVTFFEHYGWPNSCYDPDRDEMTSDPACGIRFVVEALRPHGLDHDWCYLAEDGSEYGMRREQLADRLRDCDVYFNLSNINWIPELEQCRRRVLVDTDPVFTQIGAHGLGGPFSNYDVRFTYGENIHQPGCDIPGDVSWLPTRQPVVTDIWPVRPGNPRGPFTTITNWSPLGEHRYKGKIYGQKDREFEAYFSLPRRAAADMVLAAVLPRDKRQRMLDGGWSVMDPLAATRTPDAYRSFIDGSRAEFSVAKHGYVVTQSGWFSDRSTGYMAMGRPVVLQDTGFSRFLPCGEGLLAFRNPDEAHAAIDRIDGSYEAHCRAARAMICEYFDAGRVLGRLLEYSV